MGRNKDAASVGEVPRERVYSGRCRYTPIMEKWTNSNAEL